MNKKWSLPVSGNGHTEMDRAGLPQLTTAASSHPHSLYSPPGASTGKSSNGDTLTICLNVKHLTDSQT